MMKTATAADHGNDNKIRIQNPRILLRISETSGDSCRRGRARIDPGEKTDGTGNTDR